MLICQKPELTLNRAKLKLALDRPHHPQAATTDNDAREQIIPYASRSAVLGFFGRLANHQPFISTWSGIGIFA